jgi:hypothetical protein
MLATIIAFRSPVRCVYGPAANAAIAWVKVDNDNRPLRKVFENPSDNKKRLKIALFTPRPNCRLARLTINHREFALNIRIRCQ